MNRTIRLMTISPLGHSVEVKELGELEPEELLEPGYAVLVNGRRAHCWSDLVQGCLEAEAEVIRLPLLRHDC